MAVTVPEPVYTLGMNTAQRDGLLLAASAAIGLVIMNSPWAAGFERGLTTPLQIGVGSAVLSKPLELWINDFLMAIFFLLVGIEIKQEWTQGSLATREARVLPLGAAMGGMLVPALIYLGLNAQHPAHWSGWAVPAATDIAFALGLMSLAAPRTRPAMLVFLMAVAVLDDLGAIIVIALFYTAQLNPVMLALAALCVVLMWLASTLRVMRIWPYLLLGLVLWLAVLKSGVHATLAGVVTGLMLPRLNADQPGFDPGHTVAHAIKPWVSWLILPLFGVVNAGVSLAGFSWGSLLQPVTLGIALGLMLGKPLGIVLGTWLAAKAAGGLPDGHRLLDYLPAACFCGIGFTMALFIGTLAFEVGTLAANAAKLGVLLGTLLALGLGTVVARLTERP